MCTLLGSRDVLQIPTAGAELTQAVNEGRPVVAHQPKSPVARALQTLADQVRARTARPGAQHHGR